MSKGLIIFIILVAILIAMIVILYFLGKRAEKKKAEQDEQVAMSQQAVSMLIIDKKRLKMKESGLPEAVIAQTPRYMRSSKVPIVKAKVGPKIMTLICDAQIFDDIPVKKEVKAMVSGLYITGVKGLHGKADAPEKKKKGLRAWALRKTRELNSNK